MRTVLPLLTVLTLALTNSFICSHAEENGPQDHVNQGTIEVEIKGIRNQKGVVRATLFNAPEGFPNKPNLAFKKASIPIEKDDVLIYFHETPFGDYGVGIFHDENSNMKMDANFLGMPKEGYGASNDARGVLGPPSFDDARFRMDKEVVTIKIEMVY